MTELWKEIEEFPNYMVSNLGNIKSLNYRHTKKEHLKYIATIQNGYKMVLLYKDGKYYNKLVHRLVAQAFIPNPNNYPIINHKDNNPGNNVVNNLEWCTQSYNVSYNEAGHRRQITRKLLNPNSWTGHSFIPVKQLSKDGSFIHNWPSISEAERGTGVSQRHISDCINKKRKSAGGYLWIKCW